MPLRAQLLRHTRVNNISMRVGASRDNRHWKRARVKVLAIRGAPQRIAADFIV